MAPDRRSHHDPIPAGAISVNQCGRIPQTIGFAPDGGGAAADTGQSQSSFSDPAWRHRLGGASIAPPGHVPRVVCHVSDHADDVDGTGIAFASRGVDARAFAKATKAQSG